ncbi:hypothetical protein W97_00506 [Coniosporium apollinis CBS 100218]|uniref:Uncharacterized protein n=1 Tax=Coniosporium apollinis (strain CBS 100218) TaxID=1168221 RepID=R7YHC2_CONA1|nr:uncharacterized protein W97_00506 [Coniosporium apollinis CBS 100218]EON61293.1 hypothetical protein W97_00506 [Coniosporium apollinis CBS 100218]
MTPESASKTEERKRVSTASNKRKREARSKETPASSVTKRTDDSVPSSNGKPSHDIVGPSGLCDRCKVIVIDIGKASLSTKVRDGEVVLEAPSDQDLHLGFELQDTYPEFPRLASSAAKGCRFCGFLKEEIGVEISQSVLREVDEMFGATQEEEITIDIKGLRYYWTRRFTGGLSQLWPNLRISTSSGRFSREMLLPFDIMTDFGK